MSKNLEKTNYILKFHFYRINWHAQHLYQNILPGAPQKEYLHHDSKQVPPATAQVDPAFFAIELPLDHDLSTKEMDTKTLVCNNKMKKASYNQRKLTIALFWMLRARLAYFNVFNVSSALVSAGLTQAAIKMQIKANTSLLMNKCQNMAVFQAIRTKEQNM